MYVHICTPLDADVYITVQIESMAQENQANSEDDRRTRIHDAAYALLREKGYKATSMLAIARKAKTSNETLYKHYPNKQALFGELVAENAKAARLQLQASITNSADPLETLSVIGPQLLELVTGKTAIELNRAAAGDVHDTATLGPLIAENGRNTIAPLLASLFEQAHRQGALSVPDSQLAAELYLRLLIGDLQIRRAIGVLPVLDAKDAAERAWQAYSAIALLFKPDID